MKYDALVVATAGTSVMAAALDENIVVVVARNLGRRSPSFELVKA